MNKDYLALILSGTESIHLDIGEKYSSEKISQFSLSSARL